MKTLLLTTALLIPTIALAQTQEFVLKVTPEELTAISDGLQELPFKRAMPLINKLREQIIVQQRPPVTVPEPVAPKPNNPP